MIRRITPSTLDRESLSSLIVNPSLLADDGTDYVNLFIKKPWGGEYLTFQNPQVAVWVLHITENDNTSLHCHLSKKTSLIVLGGKVCITLLDEVINLQAGDGLFLDAGVFHSTRAISAGGAIVMETETPINKRDLIRLEDNYGREKKGYEGKEFHANPIDITRQEFHNEGERYNTEKIIGECGLMILKHSHADGVLEAAKKFNPTVLGLLSGTVKVNGRDAFWPGDVLNWSEADGFAILDEAEVLLIRNINK
ncbi:MAG TPA: hypothetical protein VJL32_02135 [Candidatus Paceibacterota bacterium]